MYYYCSLVFVLIWRVFEYPRFRLIDLPTPLERASGLSRELGVEFYIKRDDIMELALGGNKARKLEFVIADILRRNCDVVVTRGSSSLKSREINCGCC